MSDDAPAAYLNTEEAAAYLRLAPATLVTWRSRRQGPQFSKLGGRIVYSREDLDEFFNANKDHVE